MERVDAGYSLEEYVERESRHLDAPLLRLELANEMEKLRQGQPWRASGHNAKTLVKYPDLRIVLIALKRGARLGEHATKGRISIQTLDGHVRLKLTDQVVDLPAGYLLGLDRLRPHDLEALEDSAVLLTISATRARPHAAP